MPTDYDLVAEQYRRAKRQPWRSVVEAYTLMELVGDPRGLDVVDLACGDGHYTRRLRRRGAARVLGVDLSHGMIDLARGEEEADPLGVEYEVRDCREPTREGEFDLAVAAYLLNYARDRADLLAMCRGVARTLRPGGRFIAVNTNPDLDLDEIGAFPDYGFQVEAAGPLAEGDPIVWEFLLEGGPLRVENYHVDRSVQEQTLRAAGFREVLWRRPRLAPEAEAERKFWTPLLAAAPVIFLECTL